MGSEKYIRLEEIGRAKIEQTDIPRGMVYISENSLKCVCLKINDDCSVALTTDSGSILPTLISKPCGATELLGTIIGVTTKTI